MVSVSRRRVKGLNPRRRTVYDKEKIAAVLLGCTGLGVLLWTVLSISAPVKETNHRLGTPVEENDPNHPHLHLVDDADEAELYDAWALDVTKLLNCQDLLTVGTGFGMAANDIESLDRKLQEAENQADMKDINMRLDDFVTDDGRLGMYMQVTAQHLFCLAATAEENQSVKKWKDATHCDATSSRRQTLLDLWSTARSLITDETIFKKVLSTAVEQERVLIGNTLNLWAPASDKGLDFMLSVLNNKQEKNVDAGGVYGLSHNLGSGKLFVDVGSCLGLTSMAIASLYPGTRIVSIEAASPNWLMQELNWRCNDNLGSPETRTVLLTGVGPSRSGTGAQVAKFLWSPQATTRTRSWTPASERQSDDMELTVQLNSWHKVLSSADIGSHEQIDVLNVDCEGCEYNLIPALSDEEYHAVSTVMGAVHWGYIPEHKLPSSERARKTHERLCKHENFARTAKECCDFPLMPVQSSVAGEILVQDVRQFPHKPSTVADVAGTLCDDFSTWALENHLHDIKSDWNWVQIKSVAD